MELAYKQIHRLIEQKAKKRIHAMWSVSLQRRSREYAMGEGQSLQ